MREIKKKKNTVQLEWTSDTWRIPRKAYEGREERKEGWIEMEERGLGVRKT